MSGNKQVRCAIYGIGWRVAVVVKLTGIRYWADIQSTGVIGAEALR